MQFTKFLPNQGGRTKVLSGFVQRRSTMLFLMRVSVFYVALISGSIQLSLASSSSGQKLEETYVTVELNHESLQALFEKIEKQTNLLFTFPEGVKNYNSLSLASGRRSVKETLDMVLKDTPVTYKQINGNLVAVFVGGGDGEKKASIKEAILQNEKTVAVFAVTGTVKDASTQEALAGVNVIVKGTTRGTTTDAEGKFNIDAEDNDVLVLSFIGYKTFETQVNSRSIIDVAMENDATELNEVVVNAGYWQVKDKERTGNISRITSREIENQPINNPLGALQGRMPGVYIQQNTGMPGGGYNIQIRGVNSLRGDSNNPLYIIDGVPFTSTSLITEAGSDIINGGNPLSNINPSDIESIDVLKDADATAIYGSRGANGVVLITTKRAKAGKTQIDINVYKGVGKVSNMMSLLNTNQWLEMRHEAFSNDNATPQSWDYDLTGAWDTTRYTDWQKELIGETANITSAELSMSGGNVNTVFLLGWRFYKESLVFPGDFGDKKVSGHFSVTHTSTNNKFSLTFSTSYVSDNNKYPSIDPTSVAISLAPVAPPVYDDNGNLNWANSSWKNPFSYLRQKYNGNTKNFITNLNLRYEVIPNLFLKASLGYTSVSRKGISSVPKSSINPAFTAALSSSTFSNNSVETWIVEPQAEYRREVGSGKLNILFGSTFQQNVSELQSVFGSGFTSDALLENIQAASTVQIFNSDYKQYRYNGIFGRVNYNLKDRYLLNLTGRRDGSSRFGPGKQFANFGAVGAAWIFTAEPFMQRSLEFISFSKLRTSYGITGSDQIGDYGYLDTYSSAKAYQGSPTLYPTRLVNPDFAWEVNKKFEGALEVGLMDNRVLFSASWYHNRSSNQLVGYSLPSTTGFSSIQYNLPATVENTGWEFEINATPVRTDKLEWTISINASIPRNKLVEYSNIEASEYANRYQVGKSLFIQKKLHYTGVNSVTGLYDFEDVDGDDNISTSTDKQFLKEISKNFYGGIQNSISYKGFRIDFFFQFVKQTGQNYMASFWNQPGLMYNNQPTVVMKRWQKPSDNTDVQKFSQSYDEAFNSYSNSIYDGDNVIGDASFIRLKNVAISYSLPNKWNEKLKLRNSRIYLQGQNLITFTNYIGMDPETQDSRVIPPLRVITAGMELTF